MELCNAKRFLCRDAFLDIVYEAKDLQTLLDEVELARKYIGLFGVFDTPIGEVLFEIDESYSHEPIVMHRFMHYDSFCKFHNDHKWIKL